MAWGLMLLAVIAAVAGIFGTGPLSSTSARTDDGVLRVSYSRFLRVTAPSQLDLEVGAAAVQGGQVRLWVSHDYLAAVDVEQIVPEPSSVSTSADAVTFTIEAEGPGPAVVTLDIQPTGIGRHRGAIGLEGGPELQVTQFVYP